MPNRPMTAQELAASRKLTAYLNRTVGVDIARVLNAHHAQHVAPHVEARSLPDDPGRGRSQEWEAEDGWLIGYSTSRVVGGRWDGKFIVTAHKPVGPGSRSGRGKVSRWEINYSRAFSTRKAAKARAVELYRQHSPRWAARNPTPGR